MVKFKIAAAAAAIALLLQTQAFAGVYTGQTVVVSGNVAYGSVLAARDSADSKGSISCYLGSYVTNADITNTTANNYLSCGATDATGHSYSCYTNNPPATWITMMASINEVSWIYFYGDAAGHCQGLNVSQGSQYL
jgi:hypothetical protein